MRTHEQQLQRMNMPVPMLIQANLANLVQQLFFPSNPSGFIGSISLPFSAYNFA